MNSTMKVSNISKVPSKNISSKKVVSSVIVIKKNIKNIKKDNKKVLVCDFLGLHNTMSLNMFRGNMTRTTM